MKWVKGTLLFVFTAGALWIAIVVYNAGLYKTDTRKILSTAIIVGECANLYEYLDDNISKYQNQYFIEGRWAVKQAIDATPPLPMPPSIKIFISQDTALKMAECLATNAGKIEAMHSKADKKNLIVSFGNIYRKSYTIGLLKFYKFATQREAGHI